jgi:SagB-type dehydrogenase family enzyme
MNPSSGNLHPTECYLLLPESDGLPACIAHYNPLLHSLEIRAELGRTAAASLGALHGFGLILSSIFWREAWKYGERAFRYTQHDIGHALGALRFSATLQGWRMATCPEIDSALLDRLLGFEAARQLPGELERADCFCWVSGADPQHIEIAAWLRTLETPSFADTPNQLSRSHADWPLIDEVARLTESPGFAAQPAQVGPASARTPSPHSAETIIRQRRSAQAYDPASSHMENTQLAQLLAATLPNGATPFDVLPLASQLHLVLFVHRVEGLAPGLYCLVRNATDMQALRNSCNSEFAWDRAERELPLYLLQQGDCRSIAKTISCHQDIAGDSAFSLGMLARFEPLVSAAPWRYPWLFWEAGLIGQALYLEAEAQGFRGTGIGCYFDDLMHELLGLRNHDWQDLYHFTIGAPQEDTRIQSKPPYHHLPQLRASRQG